MLAVAWAAFKAFGFWQKISGAVCAAAKWAFKNPWVAACLLLIASTWWFHHEATTYHDALVSRVTADAAEQKAAAAKLAAQITLSNKNAQEAQVHEQIDVAAATAAGASYKAANSVRYIFRDAAVVPAASGSSVPVVAPTSAVVLRDSDFDACTADAAYAMNAYRWAQTLKPSRP